MVLPRGADYLCVKDLTFFCLVGLLTLIYPCVLQVLRSVLAGALIADRRWLVVLAAGMSLLFVAFDMTVVGVGHLIWPIPALWE